MEIETERLLLRRWRSADLEPFAALNGDPRVMEHFPGTIGRDMSDVIVSRIEQHFVDCGFGLWAVEVAGGPPFIGFVGLQFVPFEALFTPAVEIGWRLAADQWGRGYATEAARAVVDWAWENVLNLEEIVSFTVPANLRSRRVMERLGMVRDPDGDFIHPKLPADDPLRPHVLYRLPRPV